MSRLSIKLTKRAADEYVLTCVRPDGSAARHAYHGPTAKFFPRHDLAHFAVETDFGMARGFYGLVGEGWNLADFGSPWPRGKLPDDVDPVEWVVGLFDRETGQQQPWTANEFNGFLEQFQAEHQRMRPVRRVNDADLERIREHVQKLVSEWEALPMGGTMEFQFGIPSTSLTTAR